MGRPLLRSAPLFLLLLHLHPLLLLVVFTSLVAPLLAFNGEVPLGALFDKESDAFARTGYLYAISRNKRFHGDTLDFTTVYDELDFQDSFKVASKFCSQMSGGVFLFYGRTRSCSFNILESFSRVLEMPYLTFSPHHQAWGLEEERHKSFMIYMHPDSIQPMADLILQMEWTRVDYLYDSDDGLLRAQSICSLLKQYEVLVDMRRWRVNDVEDAHEDLRRIDRKDKLWNGRYVSYQAIVLDLSSLHAYKAILRQIPEVGMNRFGYNYLLGTLDFRSLDLSRFRHGGVNVTGFQLVRHNTSKVRDFLGDWLALEDTVWPGAGTSVVHLDSALSLDAIEAVRHALTELMARDRMVFSRTFRRATIYNYNQTKGIPCNTRPVVPWMHGKAIYRALTQVSFEGLTGTVAFDDSGRRRDYTLDVLTVSLESEPYKIGEWSARKGLHFYPSEKNWTESFPMERLQRIVSTILTPPYLMKKTMVEEGLPIIGTDAYEGYCRDLADEVARLAGYEYIFRLVPDSEYGRELENATWSGIIGELRRGVADLAIAPLTITSERERVVDFSKPFMNVGITIMIKRPEKQKPGIFSFMAPFSLPVWCCITAAYLTVSFCIFLVSRFSPEEMRPPQGWRNLRVTKQGAISNQFSLINSLWFCMGAFMMQGSDQCPRSTAGRLIGGVWWFFVLIVISSYTANLAAFLTIERMISPIESADDLAKQSEIAYGMVEFGSTRAFFEKSQVPTYQSMWNYMSGTSPTVFVKSIEEGVERVRNSNGRYALLVESSSNDYYNNRKPCDTIKIGPPLNLRGFGIATPHGSDLKKRVNYAVLKLKEDGTLLKFYKTWWLERGSCGSDTGYRESKKRSLALSNIAGAFYILISGLVVSILTGLVESFCLKNSNQPAFVGTGTRSTRQDIPEQEAFISGLAINGDVPRNFDTQI